MDGASSLQEHSRHFPAICAAESKISLEINFPVNASRLVSMARGVAISSERLSTWASLAQRGQQESVADDIGEGTGEAGVCRNLDKLPDKILQPHGKALRQEARQFRQGHLDDNAR